MRDSLENPQDAEKVQEITKLLSSLDEDVLKRIPRDVLLDFSFSVSTWSHKASQEIFTKQTIGPCPHGGIIEEAEQEQG